MYIKIQIPQIGLAQPRLVLVQVADCHLQDDEPLQALAEGQTFSVLAGNSDHVAAVYEGRKRTWREGETSHHAWHGLS